MPYNPIVTFTWTAIFLSAGVYCLEHWDGWFSYIVMFISFALGFASLRYLVNTTMEFSGGVLFVITVLVGLVSDYLTFEPQDMFYSYGSFFSLANLLQSITGTLIAWCAYRFVLYTSS